MTSPEAPGDSWTVLVVDDEADLRSVVTRVLGRRGYRVLAASGPADALALCRTHDGPIHLLLTDVTMPGGTGSQLADGVRRLLPEIAVLYMSGYPAAHAVAEGMVPVGSAVLSKPFTPAILVDTVRSALEGAARPV